MFFLLEPRPLCEERSASGCRILPERVSAFTKGEVRGNPYCQEWKGVAQSYEDMYRFTVMRGRVYMDGSCNQNYVASFEVDKAFPPS